MLTPSDIQSREFLVSLRGYDRDEVHAFLDEVAEEFANLLAQTGGAPAEQDEAAPETEKTAAATAPEPAPAPRPAEPKISEFAAIGAETQRILEAAAAAGEEIRRKAEVEAEAASKARIDQAQAEVDNLREEAAAIRSQIDELTSRRDDLGDRLRQIRERVDLALLEIEDEGPQQVPDSSNSVLAAEAEPVEEPAETDDATSDDDSAGGDAGKRA